MCESFMKTLKQEEIYCQEYGDLEDLRVHIEEFLDRHYNRQRLHSALGYRMPVEFERKPDTKLRGGLRRSEDEFFQTGEIYRSEASCSPAELASASPDQYILLDRRPEVVEDYSEQGTEFILRVSPQGFTSPRVVDPRLRSHQLHRESKPKSSAKKIVRRQMGKTSRGEEYTHNRADRGHCQSNGKRPNHPFPMQSNLPPPDIQKPFHQSKQKNKRE
jgi:hypothetical protein